MLRAVIFDLDNTLLLKRPSVVDQLVEQSAAPEHAARAYAESEAWQGAQILHENRTGIRMDDAEYAENIARFYAGALGGRMDTALQIVLDSRPVRYETAPGAFDALSALRDMELALGVASNNRAMIRAVLTELGLAPFFGSVCISDEVGVLKPDPRMMEIACAGLGVARAEAVYVGDHPFDVLCAHEAGMKAIWLPPNQYFSIPEGIAEPDYTARNLSEVPGFVRRMAM
jgi:HAD superfamily hydrolase (TIGR01509 family)